MGGATGGTAAKRGGGGGEGGEDGAGGNEGDGGRGKGNGGTGGGGDGAATASMVAVTPEMPRTVTPSCPDRAAVEVVVSVTAACCAAPRSDTTHRVATTMLADRTSSKMSSGFTCTREARLDWNAA